jgi:hypothetical protein
VIGPKRKEIRALEGASGGAAFLHHHGAATSHSNNPARAYMNNLKPTAKIMDKKMTKNNNETMSNVSIILNIAAVSTFVSYLFFL